MQYPFIHLAREGTGRESVVSKNETHCPRSGLEPGPLDPEGSAVSIGPQHLPVREVWSRVMMDKRIVQSELCCYLYRKAKQ